MSAISTILTRLRAAIWAIDVRDDIANAIEQCYSDVSNPTLKTEALEAALQNKIDQGKMAALTIGDGTITGAKLANGTIPKAKLDPSITFDADAALDPTSTNAIQNKVVASELATVKADLGDIGDIDAIKSALMACFKKVAWSDGGGQDCYDDLYDALYTTTNEVRIDGTRLTWEDGYIDASGELTVSSGAKTSNFIDVSGYSSYEISLENASSLRMAFYNSSKEFLSRSLVGSDSIPSNASYGRVTIGRSDLLEGVDYDGTGTTIVLTKTGGII